MGYLGFPQIIFQSALQIILGVLCQHRAEYESFQAGKSQLDFL